MAQRPTNPTLSSHRFLADMYGDGYFPDNLVALVEAVLLALCVEIERADALDLAGLYRLTHRATEQVNALQELFWEAGSEIETGARETIAGDFAAIATAYGFEADIEELIAPRDW